MIAYRGQYRNGSEQTIGKNNIKISLLWEQNIFPDRIIIIIMKIEWAESRTFVVVVILLAINVLCWIKLFNACKPVLHNMISYEYNKIKKQSLTQAKQNLKLEIERESFALKPESKIERFDWLCLH